MKNYQITIEQKKSLSVTCDGTDVLEIALDNNNVATSYIVNFSETTVDSEPGYSKKTFINGIEDVLFVKKSQLSPDDQISSIELNKDYLFMAVHKDDETITRPYYIKLPE